MIPQWRVNQPARQGMTHCFRRSLDLTTLGLLALSFHLKVPKNVTPVLPPSASPLVLGSSAPVWRTATPVARHPFPGRTAQQGERP
jgi:hypothetical protein